MPHQRLIDLAAEHAEDLRCIDALEAAYWASYKRDVEHLEGEAYEVQERRSWRRLQRYRALLTCRRRAAALEYEYALSEIRGPRRG